MHCSFISTVAGRLIFSDQKLIYFYALVHFWGYAPAYIPSLPIKTHIYFLGCLPKKLHSLSYTLQLQQKIVLKLKASSNRQPLHSSLPESFYNLRHLVFLCFLLHFFCQYLVFVKLSPLFTIFLELGNFLGWGEGILWNVMNYFINSESLVISVLNTGTVIFFVCLFICSFCFYIPVNCSAQVLLFSEQIWPHVESL